MRLLLGILALLMLPATALALDIGPAVGAKVPAISATHIDGRKATIQSLSSRNGVVLFFVRSASWCPFCQAQLIALKDAQAPLAQRGYTLVGISYDEPTVLRDFAARRQIGYTLLSDVGSRTIDAFKIRDPQYPPGNMAHGVPQPVIFVVARTGEVRGKLAEEGFRTRPPVSAVIAAVDAAAKR